MKRISLLVELTLSVLQVEMRSDLVPNSEKIAMHTTEERRIVRILKAFELSRNATEAGRRHKWAAITRREARYAGVVKMTAYFGSSDFLMGDWAAE
jgi:hypothetical protein